MNRLKGPGDLGRSWWAGSAETTSTEEGGQRPTGKVKGAEWRAENRYA